MTLGDVLTNYTATIEFDRYEDIREALFHRDLSRSFDKRAYHQGNVREGVVSIVHGAVHRARRRVENTQFRPDRLREYERELFPGVLSDLLDRLIVDEHVDLFPLGEYVSVVLAARRAGIDFDADDLGQLRTLVGYVDAFSQGSAILDAKDPDAVRALVRKSLEEFERDFVRSAWARRAAIVASYQRGEIHEADLPRDILTVLLVHRSDPSLELGDDGRVVREVATYLQGGTHTSSQTLINTLDLLFPAAESDPTLLSRVVSDRLFAQRCIHETLRLRPTTPKIRRRAEADLTIAGKSIPKDAMVVLNAAVANRDPGLFGADADAFNPDRAVGEDVPRWGLSFGAGAHQCPGRLVAGGLPVPTSFEVDSEHLFGLVAQMVQEVVRRGVRPDPDRKAVPDTRTERYTRWAEYPVLFPLAKASTAAVR
jgi:cytochrome P450